MQIGLVIGVFSVPFLEKFHHNVFASFPVLVMRRSVMQLGVGL